jgi:D-glycero-D-manno-heptose 1,7-bisphosphate phosphatase
VRQLKENDIEELVLLLGYLPDRITEYFGDGHTFGLSIRYSITPVEDERGTRLRKAASMLDDYFLVMNSDSYWPLDLQKLVDFHNKHNALVSMTVYTNKDAVTKNNVLVDAQGIVRKYDVTRSHPALNGVDAAYRITSKKILKLIPEDNVSLEETVFPQLIFQNQLVGYLTDDRYWSIGTPEKLAATERFFRLQ